MVKFNISYPSVRHSGQKNVDKCKLEGKYSLESTDPCESEIRVHLRP